MALVIVRSHGSFRNEIEAGPHHLIADEPVTAGGSDEGPTPYDFLSAALGGCTSMTMHFLARRENIPLEGVEIAVTNDRRHAQDCADCVTTSGFIHRFDVQIRLVGNLTPEQRDRLLTAAQRCPVRKTLMSEIRIDERLVDEITTPSSASA